MLASRNPRERSSSNNIKSLRRLLSSFHRRYKIIIILFRVVIQLEFIDCLLTQPGLWIGRRSLNLILCSLILKECEPLDNLTSLHTQTIPSPVFVTKLELLLLLLSTFVGLGLSFISFQIILLPEEKAMSFPRVNAESKHI